MVTTLLLVVAALCVAVLARTLLDPWTPGVARTADDRLAQAGWPPSRLGGV